MAKSHIRTQAGEAAVVTTAATGNTASGSHAAAAGQRATLDFV
jgi:hypothetical protein